MPHIVTQACCGDASCVFACPVNCIHPTPDEPDFTTSEMVYIDPDSCVDCGACVNACPVSAITPDTKIEPAQLPFVDINAMFYQQPRTYPIQAPVPETVKLGGQPGPLRVAIVGSGPAALYAADELLKQRGVEVNVFDKLPTPHGLVRAGVAPDHQMTKKVDALFRQIEDQDGFGYFLGVEVGHDITHAELLEHHHAVLYATGASQDRTLGIPGEDLAGSAAATDFVAWYNGHPDYADRTFDFDQERAVIVGNGNVALDVARILASDPDELASTDIADHALEALRHSKIEEVVVLARRGVGQAAYTLPELVGLLGRDDIDFVVDPDELALDSVTGRLRATGRLDPTVERKIQAIEEVGSRRPVDRRGKRIVFRYLVSPTELTGDGAVSGINLVRNKLTASVDGVIRAMPTQLTESIEAGIVLRSVGYRGEPLAGLPFDTGAGVVPNEAGRVVATLGGDHLRGSYVAGWIKRGPTGFIGTNKTCAHETVSNLLRDFNQGVLRSPPRSRAALKSLIGQRQSGVIDLRGWRTIDLTERARGHEQGRVRQKFTDTGDMVAIARRKNRRRGLPRGTAAIFPSRRAK